MNKVSLLFLLFNSILLIYLPRRFAALPLLLGSCYVTRGQIIDFGPLSFSFLRLLILVGFIRILFRFERPLANKNNLDLLIFMLSLSAIFSSLFHKEPFAALIFRLGFVFDVAGIYFLFRNFCRSFDELIIVFRVMAILLMPIALEMIFEKINAFNLFSFFGGIPEVPQIRQGSIRAQGPFGHPILAGTVGATCLPFMIGLWTENKKTGFIGIISCLIIVFASSSSGPILSTIAGCGALILWQFRKQIKIYRWIFILGYIVIDIYMNSPAYYIVTRLKFIGGSTAWHRARLIESGIEHINEWWLAGTDYTRHWMPSGVSWSRDHTDITNYYLKMGVIGGLPMMFFFIFIIWVAFKYIGEIIKLNENLDLNKRFIFWTLGASLFSIAATSLSVSFFDQSFIFVYMNIGIISSIRNNFSIKSI